MREVDKSGSSNGRHGNAEGGQSTGVRTDGCHGAIADEAITRQTQVRQVGRQRQCVGHGSVINARTVEQR